MGGINLIMTFVDTIPVVFFILFYIELIKFFDGKMSGFDFAILTGGNMLCIVAGICKVLWKLLYALNVCDYTVLAKMFFPLTTFAYFLMAYGLHKALKSLKGEKKKEENKVYAAVPVVTSNLPFILGTFIGTIWYYVECVRVALFYKSKKSAVLFILSFVFVLTNSIVSSKFDNSSSMHWLAQCVNCCSLGLQYFALKVLTNEK